MRLTFSLPAALLGLAAIVRASNVVDLNSDNFDSLIGKDKPALVEFFAPWCGHCKTLAPTYEQLADAFPKDKVIIAKTDADGEGRALGERFGVQGYPTLKWFPAGSVEPVDYGGGRDLESLVGYVTNQAGVKSSIKPPPPPAAVQLDVTNFDDVVNGSKNVIVAFTAPWCGHCKNMKPAYEAVARAFINEPDVVVAQMQADAPENKDIAMRYDVRSFPTIKFFPKNSTEWISYDMARTEGQFTVFLNEQCGTHRTASGLLDDAAGRVAMLDALARKYVSDLPSRADIAAKTKEAIADVAKDTRAAADYYVKAMERIAAKGDAWLKKESTRLTNLLASPTIAPKKLDEIKVKLNILKAFVEDKAEDLKEEAEKVAKDIKDEL